MAAIRIRFITENGLTPSAVRLFTRAPRRGYSHVEFILEDGSYLGAHIDGGVMIRPADYCVPTAERRYATPCSDSEYIACMNFAHAQIGKKYDLLNIAGLALNRDWHHLDRWICSRLVITAMMYAGIYPLNVQLAYTYRIDPERLHLSPLLIGHCYYSRP